MDYRYLGSVVHGPACTTWTSYARRPWGMLGYYFFPAVSRPHESMLYMMSMHYPIIPIFSVLNFLGCVVACNNMVNFLVLSIFSFAQVNDLTGIVAYNNMSNSVRSRQIYFCTN